MVDLRPLRFLANTACRSFRSSSDLSTSGGAAGGGGGGGGGGGITTGGGGGGGGGGLGALGGLKNEPMCFTPILLCYKVMKTVFIWQSYFKNNIGK